jgi:uncharacterized membrane protein
MSLGLLPHLLWGGRFIHFFGLALAIGPCVAALLLLRSAKKADAGQRPGIERAAADLVSRVEIPGVFVSILGGILLVVERPEVFDPARSGAGPWLHIKLALVMGALVIAHVRMFNVKRLVRERASGGAEADLDRMLDHGRRLDLAGVAIYTAILFVVCFRVMLFG